VSKPTVGFVGVGLMGHGMAKNLVSKGWPLVVLGHRKREPVEHLKSLGAREAATPRELAAAFEAQSGRTRGIAPERQRFAEMMEQYPDG